MLHLAFQLWQAALPGPGQCCHFGFDLRLRPHPFRLLFLLLFP
jgi:hypothetical protein